jgi:hypothetical protein
MISPKSKTRLKVIAFIVTIIIIVLFGSIGKFTFDDVFDTSDVNVKAQLLKMSGEINKKCPYMLDSETRLDDTGAYRKSFYYYCTLIKYNISEVDVKYLINKLKPALLNGIKTNPDMEYFRDHKVTIIYYYRDKSGNHIVSFRFAPQDYLLQK